MSKETEFRRWRRQLGFTQAEAADALGLSKSQIENLDQGIDRTRGRPAIPSLAVRHLMREIADGLRIEPWPAEAAPPVANEEMTEKAG